MSNSIFGLTRNETSMIPVAVWTCIHYWESSREMALHTKYHTLFAYSFTLVALHSSYSEAWNQICIENTLIYPLDLCLIIKLHGFYLITGHWINVYCACLALWLKAASSWKMMRSNLFYQNGFKQVLHLSATYNVAYPVSSDPCVRH